MKDIVSNANGSGPSCGYSMGNKRDAVRHECDLVFTEKKGWLEFSFAPSLVCHFLH
jgi:hypothetical protein